MADMPDPSQYRPCVGIAVFNRAGLVWIGSRLDGPEEPEGNGAWWQMPQGGIDGDEEPYDAALRELHEETNIRSVSPIIEAPEWFFYDLPPELAGKAWGGRYRGQRQKWFAFRFEGDESEIDIHHPAGGAKPEFALWRWEELTRLPALIVPFKRPVYEKVVEAFMPVAGR